MNLNLNIFHFLLLVFLCITLSSCSSSQQQEDAQLDQDGDYGEDGNEYGDGQINQGEASEYTDQTSDGLNDLNDGDYGLGDAEAELDQSGNDLEDAFTDTNAAYDAAPGPTGDGERVVRYVIEDGVSVYSEASASAEVVATLTKGLPLMVVDMGEWSQIDGSRYVRTESLSEVLIPRHMQPAKWTAP